MRLYSKLCTNQKVAYYHFMKSWFVEWWIKELVILKDTRDEATARKFAMLRSKTCNIHGMCVYRGCNVLIRVPLLRILLTFGVAYILSLDLAFCIVKYDAELLATDFAFVALPPPWAGYFLHYYALIKIIACVLNKHSFPRWSNPPRGKLPGYFESINWNKQGGVDLKIRFEISSSMTFILSITRKTPISTG